MFRKEIPNILTLCNLLCGCISISCVFSENVYGASLFIFLAAVFDLFDGMIARILRVSSGLGRELDSLADVVSFGAAPSFIAFHMIRAQTTEASYWAYPVLVMAAASAYRLAKFNTDEEQRHYFKGLPTPANAVFWASLGIYWAKEGFLMNVYAILVLSFVLAFLMICNYKMFAFKSKDWSWRSRKMVYSFLIAAVVLFVFFDFLGLAVSIMLYPVFSWLHFNMNVKPVK